MFILATILCVIWFICAVINRFVKIPNHLSRAQRPSDLTSCSIQPSDNLDFVDDSEAPELSPLTANTPVVPSDVIYIPPRSPDPSLTSPHNVYIILAGNPGASTFYIDYLERVQNEADGKLHCYAIGHAFHTPSFDSERFQAYTEEQLKSLRKNKKDATPIDTILPNFESQRLINSTTRPHINTNNAHFLLTHEDSQDYINADPITPEIPLLNLKQQIAQKYALVAKIRARHPHAKLIIAGHSMGSYCALETLRNIERGYILKHYGELGLFLFDLQEEKEMSSSNINLVENPDQYPIQVPIGAPEGVTSIPDKISRVLFSPAELQLWEDSMLLNTAAPENIPIAPLSITTHVGDNDDYSAEKKAQEDKYREEILEHIAHNLPNATSFIHSLHGLMPTIMRIANTPNGHFLTPWFGRRRILAAAVYLIARLPAAVKHTLINFAAPAWSSPDIHITVRMFLSEIGIHNCIYLATDEMYNIRSLDLRFVRRNAGKLFFYMSNDDEWAPQYQREYLEAVNATWKKEGQKELMTIQVCVQGAKHAFVFNANHIVARHSIAFAKQKQFL